MLVKTDTHPPPPLLTRSPIPSAHGLLVRI